MLVRTWQPAERAWKYTNLGRGFYSRRKIEWLVEIPVIVRGKQRNSQGQYERKRHMPVSMIGVSSLATPESLEREAAQRRLRAEVLRRVVSTRRLRGRWSMSSVAKRISWTPRARGATSPW